MSKADIKEFNPIRDIDEEWELDEGASNDDRKIFRAKRCSSLFKMVNESGEVKYTDVKRFIGIDINNPRNTHNFVAARMILDELYPIEFPYAPGDPFKIYTESFYLYLTGVDTHVVLITYIKEPNNTMNRVMRAFTMVIGEWELKEIPIQDYLELKMKKENIHIKNELQKIEDEVTKNVERKDS